MRALSHREQNMIESVLNVLPGVKWTIADRGILHSVDSSGLQYGSIHLSTHWSQNAKTRTYHLGKKCDLFHEL